METSGTTLPKIDRSDWDHDPEAVEVYAWGLIAGDLVPGLGILDAILDEGHDPSADRTLLLCAGSTAWRVRAEAPMTAHGAICPDCDMHPHDCYEYGCGRCAAAVA